MNREEAIKILKSHYPTNKQMLNEALEFLIPELKEDEDDRIKLKNLQRSLVWLEKYDEKQTLREWSKEDERERKRIIDLLEGWLSTFKEKYYA